MSLQNRVAVVTGGSRGIGKAICLKLAQSGASILLCYAGHAAAAEETARQCRSYGADAQAVQCDVTNSKAVKSMIKEALLRFGRIDILVNNAGVTRDGFMLMMSEADYDTVVDTNLKGTFLCIKSVVHTMMKQQYGRIINVSSVTGLRGNAGQTNYAASKAGVIGLTKSAAKELAFKGITVNAVAPGFICTDMTEAMTKEAREAALSAIPAGRLGQAEDVAQAVAFLAGDEASYITGQVLAVDGGMSM